jgi:tetratricopeptide (TPR) repeat protein
MAKKHLQIASNMLVELHGEESLFALGARLLLGQVALSHGDALTEQNVLRQVMPVVRKTFDANNASSRQLLAVALNDLAVVQRWSGHPDSAEASLKEGLALRPYLPDEDEAVAAIMRSNLVAAIADQGRLEEARSLLRQSIAAFPSNAETPDLASLLTLLGSYYGSGDSSVVADSLLQRAEHMYRQFLSPNHLRLGDNLLAQSSVLYQQRLYHTAERKVEEALRIFRKASGTRYFNYPVALGVQGLIWNKTNRTGDAENILREALKLQRSTLPHGYWLIAQTQCHLAEVLKTQKKFDEAESLLVESYESLRLSQGEGNQRTMLAKHQLAWLYQAMNKPELAVKYHD